MPAITPKTRLLLRGIFRAATFAFIHICRRLERISTTHPDWALLRTADVAALEAVCAYLNTKLAERVPR